MQRGRQQLAAGAQLLSDHTTRLLKTAQTDLAASAQLLEALNPEAVLRRGYAIVRQDGRLVRTTQAIASGAIVDIQLSDGQLAAEVTKVSRRQKARD